MKKIKSKGYQCFNIPNTDEGKAVLKQMRRWSNGVLISCRGRSKNRKTKGGNKWYTPLKTAEWIAVYIKNPNLSETQRIERDRMSNLVRENRQLNILLDERARRILFLESELKLIANDIKLNTELGAKHDRMMFLEQKQKEFELYVNQNTKDFNDLNLIIKEKNLEISNLNKQIEALSNGHLVRLEESANKTIQKLNQVLSEKDVDPFNDLLTLKQNPFSSELKEVAKKWDVDPNWITSHLQEMFIENPQSLLSYLAQKLKK